MLAWRSVLPEQAQDAYGRLADELSARLPEIPKPVRRRLITWRNSGLKGLYRECCYLSAAVAFQRVGSNPFDRALLAAQLGRFDMQLESPARLMAFAIGERLPAEQLPYWPDTGGGMESVPEGDRFSRLHFPADWAGSPPRPRQWAVKDWIPAGCVSLLAGGPGVGKTTFALLLAYCAAVGRNFAGLEVAQGAALVVSLEDDRDEMHRRLAAVADGIGEPLGELGDQLALWDLRGDANSLLGSFDAESRWKPSAFFGEIEALCHEREVRLLVLDNLAHLYGGNENDRAAVTRFVAALDGLAQRQGLAVVLIGHPAKVEGSEWSGSTAWEASVRARLFLSRPKADGVERDGPERVLSRSKSNYAAKGERLGLTWLRGTFWPTDSLPVDAVQEGASSSRDAEVERLFIELLAELSLRSQAVSSARNAGNYAPKIMLSMDGAETVTRPELERAMVRMIAKGRLQERAELWRGPDRKMQYGLKVCGTVQGGSA